MMILEEKEIFNSIASFIVRSEPNSSWNKATLKMAVIGSSVDFNLNFIYSEEVRENVKLQNAFFCSREVLKLHKLTNENLNYKRWNRALYTLYDNSKMEIEYIWDQLLQDEVDKFNR